MKNLLLLIITLTTVVTFSQSTRLVTLKLGTLDIYTALRWEINLTISNETDSSKYFALIYQNSEYKYIVDQSIIIFFDKEEVRTLCNKLITFGEQKYDGYYSENVLGINFIITNKYGHLKDKDGKTILIQKNKLAKLGNDILANIDLLD